MKLIEYDDSTLMMRDVADVLATDLIAALAQHPQVSFAVPGGTTPGPVFDALSAVDLDWGRVHIILTDERWVPEDHPQSNAALLRARLLTGKASAATFTPFYLKGVGIAEALEQRSEEIAPVLPLDVCLLGMGADMHTASLFPDAQGLNAALSDTAPPLLPIKIAGQEVGRATLTAPVLRAAKQVHLLIKGQDKRGAVERAAELPEAQAPVRCVLDGATVHWSAT